MIDYRSTYYTAPCGREVQCLGDDGTVDGSASITTLRQHINSCDACRKQAPEAA